MNSTFDFRQFRTEKLKITQTQLSEALGIRQDTVSRYEENPDEIPLKVIESICRIYGISFNELLNYQRIIPTALKMTNQWEAIEKTRNRLIEKIQQIKLADSQSDSIMNPFIDFAYSVSSKPKVVLLGRSDSGKSTLINTILGMDKLPASWTPVTSILIYIKHSDDRPVFIKDDLWIFKNDFNDNYWDDRRLNDEEYTTSLKVAGGDASLLKSYGTGDGIEFKAHSDQIGSAVLFVDSSILKNCDFVDVPGFTGGKPGDVKAAQYAGTRADILMYLSQANSFMSIDDVVYLSGAMNSLAVIERFSTPELPKLSNLYVLATQAHIINGGNSKELEKILNCGCSRFYNTLTEGFWDERKEISGYKEYTEPDLRNRFYAYTTDIQDIRSPFEKNFSHLLEIFPHLLFISMKEKLDHYREALAAELMSKIRYQKSLLSDYTEMQEQIRRRELSQPQVLRDLKQWKKDTLKEIELCRQTAWNQFLQNYYKTVSEDGLIELLKSRDTQNKKKSKEDFLIFLSAHLDEMQREAIRTESKVVCKEIDRYIDECQCAFDGVDAVKNDGYKNNCILAFQAKRQFAAGISGIATFGALAIWASTLGNLGGYIIVAKAVSLLAALGIHLGGTAAVIGAVSASGGPVAWGIGIAVLIGLAIFGIVGGGWRKQFAKSVCAEMCRQNALEEYKKANLKFWNDTASAFEMGADEMARKWVEQTEQMKNDLRNYDRISIQKEIVRLENLKDRIDKIQIV